MKDVKDADLESYVKHGMSISKTDDDRKFFKALTSGVTRKAVVEELDEIIPLDEAVSLSNMVIKIGDIIGNVVNYFNNGNVSGSIKLIDNLMESL